MLSLNRRSLPRAARRTLFACTLPSLVPVALAQTSGSPVPAPSSSSSTTQTQQPTQPAPPSQTNSNGQPTQPGVVAAPGSAPIRSRVAAREINPLRITQYDEKITVFGGLLYANGQAGQNLPKHYNMGGGEGMVTYWLTPRLGAVADYRLQAGTSPVLPVGAQFGLNRVTVKQSILSGGAEFRGPRNRYAAINLHGLGGATYGIFDTAIRGYPSNLTPQPTAAYVGLYDNHLSGWAAAGGSIDFNQTPRLAVRLAPEITFEHFGTELREFFSITGGVVYRIGKR